MGGVCVKLLYKCVHSLIISTCLVHKKYIYMFIVNVIKLQVGIHVPISCLENDVTGFRHSDPLNRLLLCFSLLLLGDSTFSHPGILRGLPGILGALTGSVLD